MKLKRKGVFAVLFAVAITAVVAYVFNPFHAVAHIAPRTSHPFNNRPTSDALVKAAGEGDLATMKRLLDSGVSPDADSQGDEGISALSAASAGGKIEAVKLLLGRGADVNDDDFWGGNALVGASLFGQVEVVRVLLAHGADPNMEDDGASAIGYASRQLIDHTEKASISDYRLIVKLLKDAGAKASALDNASNLLSHLLP